MDAKDELVEWCAREFFAFLSALPITWDEGYCRVSNPGGRSVSYNWTYRSGREINSHKVSRTALRDFFKPYNEQVLRLFDQLEKDGGERPFVALLILDASGSYKFEFGFENPEQHDVSILNSGQKNSYFYEDECIDNPSERYV